MLESSVVVVDVVVDLRVLGLQWVFFPCERLAMSDMAPPGLAPTIIINGVITQPPEVGLYIAPVFPFIRPSRWVITRRGPTLYGPSNYNTVIW